RTASGRSCGTTARGSTISEPAAGVAGRSRAGHQRWALGCLHPVRQLRHHRVVVAQRRPAGPGGDPAGREAPAPGRRHEDAVAVAGAARAGAPPGGRRGPRPGMGGLPAADEVELPGEALEDLPLAARHWDPFAGLAIADDDVEVPAEDEIRAIATPGDPVQELVHRAHVAPLAGRAVNAENAERTRRGPRRTLDLHAHAPAAEPPDREGRGPGIADEDRAAPAPPGCEGREERVCRSRSEPLPGRVVWRAALLGEDDVRGEARDEA